MSSQQKELGRLLPTQLIHPSERRGVPEAEEQVWRFRSFYVIGQLGRLFVGNAFLRLGGKRTQTRRDERTIHCLKRLGMLWIRTAQALCLRSHRLSQPFGRLLMDLRDSGGAHPFPLIRRIVEAELERPLEEVFDYFEETPFSSTTVSQLHRARLRKEQVWTAVKVQQPDADTIFTKDLKLFRRIIRSFKLFSIKSGMRWDEMFHELNEIKVRELNYYYEASALEAFEENLRDRPIHVPLVYHEYCRRRVLVMEFIRGARLFDVIVMRRKDPERLHAWLKANDIDLAKVARRLFHAVYRQIFEDTFFHGDMNTGNIILLRDSHIAVVECRSAGSLDQESLEKQKIFLRSLSENEWITAAEIYFLLASRLPRVDLNIIKDQLVQIWRVWETRTHIESLPYPEKSFACMTGMVNRVVNESGFAPLWSFSLLNGALVHLDISIAVLDPCFNYLERLRTYFRRKSQREQVEKLKAFPTRLASAVTALQQVPKRIEEYGLFKDALIRRQAQVVQESTSRLDIAVAACFGFASLIVSLSVVYLLLVFCAQHFGFDPRPWLGSQINQLVALMPPVGVVPGVALLVLCLMVRRVFKRQQKRFSRREYGGGNGNNG